VPRGWERPATGARAEVSDRELPRRPGFSDPVEPPPAGRPWTVLHLLRWSTQHLEGRGIPDVRLDVEYLLAHVLGLGRMDLYLQFERPLETSELERFRPLLRARSRRQPLQYILGTASFRDLELRVDPRVLIPRPETEELVEAVLLRVREWGREGLRAVDLGTGSGAIALSLAQEGPFREVLATDASAGALEVARANALRHGLASRVSFHLGDLFEALPPGTTVPVLVSNPPYVAAAELAGLAPEVQGWEPHQALISEDLRDAGDGLGLLDRIIRGAVAVVEPGGLLALEIGAGQGTRVLDLLRETEGWEGSVVLRDLSRRERIVLSRRTR
jgi:release factor glutamine methyltransferase